MRYEGTNKEARPVFWTSTRHIRCDLFATGNGLKLCFAIGGLNCVNDLPMFVARKKARRPRAAQRCLVECCEHGCTKSGAAINLVLLFSSGLSLIPSSFRQLNDYGQINATVGFCKIKCNHMSACVVSWQAPKLSHLTGNATQNLSLKTFCKIGAQSKS
jgi:hypothetical protein